MPNGQVRPELKALEASGSVAQATDATTQAQGSVVIPDERVRRFWQASSERGREITRKREERWRALAAQTKGQGSYGANGLTGNGNSSSSFVALGRQDVREPVWTWGGDDGEQDVEFGTWLRGEPELPAWMQGVWSASKLSPACNESSAANATATPGAYVCTCTHACTKTDRQTATDTDADADRQTHTHTPSAVRVCDRKEAGERSEVDQESAGGERSLCAS